MRILPLILMLAAATPLAAQSRAQQFAAEFNKKKDETRTKKGHSVHKYKEVVAAPWTFKDNRQYAGTYSSEEFAMKVVVDDYGRIHATGHDHHGSYELRNPMIDEGVLTGTRVYRDGRSESLKAIFLKRQSRSSATDQFDTSYGIGYLENYDDQIGARIFLERQ